MSGPHSAVFKQPGFVIIAACTPDSWRPPALDRPAACCRLRRPRRPAAAKGDAVGHGARCILDGAAERQRTMLKPVCKENKILQYTSQQKLSLSKMTDMSRMHKHHAVSDDRYACKHTYGSRRRSAQ